MKASFKKVCSYCKEKKNVHHGIRSIKLNTIMQKKTIYYDKATLKVYDFNFFFPYLSFRSNC